MVSYSQQTRLVKLLREKEVMLNKTSDGLKKLPDTFIGFCELVYIKAGSSKVKFSEVIFDYQIELTEYLLQDGLRGCVINKGRQLAITTLTSILLAYLACTKNGFVGAWISLSQRDASKVAQDIRDILTDIENAGYIRLESQSLLNIRVQNGGQLIFRPSSVDALRGYSVDVLVGDEIAFNPETGWGSCYLHWRANPRCLKIENESSLGFLGTMKQQLSLDDETIQREFNLSFTSSSEVFFKADVLNTMLIEELPDDIDSGLKFYGLDCSGLTGNDFLVLTIVSQCYDHNTQESYYILHDLLRMNKGTLELAIFKIGEVIGEHSEPFYIGVEKNSMGGIYLDEIVRGQLVPEVEGINTTRSNKVELLSRIRFLAETGKLKVWSGMKSFKQFTKEFLNFKIDGSSNVNDDIPMSLSMLCQGISKYGL
ncbi:MAG: hypothetical protein AB4368_13755 [Xenococcaceae cyanobacterium]